MTPPKIPMSPADLPEQQGVKLSTIPERPEIWDSTASWGGSDLPKDIRIDGEPDNKTYLFQAEWSWSPFHSRLNAFYICKSKKYWILYSNYLDDDDETWIWNPVASVPVEQANERLAAIWLVIDYMIFDRDNGSVEEWHMINEEGFLKTSEITAIANFVWENDDVVASSDQFKKALAEVIEFLLQIAKSHRMTKGPAGYSGLFIAIAEACEKTAQDVSEAISDANFVGQRLTRLANENCMKFASNLKSEIISKADFFRSL